jgi:hypothetical protein
MIRNFFNWYQQRVSVEMTRLVLALAFIAGYEFTGFAILLVPLFLVDMVIYFVYPLGLRLLSSAEGRRYRSVITWFDYVYNILFMIGDMVYMAMQGHPILAVIMALGFIRLCRAYNKNVLKV